MTREKKQPPRTGHFFQPATSFCCGCPLDLGIKVILLFHGMGSVFYMLTALGNIVFEAELIGHTVTLSTQCINCAIAIASIPFIIFGFYGVKYHVEVHLRIYLYWLIFTLVLDTVCLGILAIKNSCAALPAILAHSGGAFACGAMRLVNIFFIGMVLSFSGYAVFVVWSRCEEFREGDSQGNFDSLLAAEHAKKEDLISRHKSGLFGIGPKAREGVPAAYGSLASPIVGGGLSIFGGRTHEFNQLTRSPYDDLDG